MSASPVTVIARFRAKPGEADAVREILLSLLAPTRAEQGCLNYDLHQSATSPDEFLFHENWTTQEDLDRHLKSPHVVQAISKVLPLTAGSPEVTLWSRIG
jgi:quinol monooxygenase YgiN